MKRDTEIKYSSHNQNLSLTAFALIECLIVVIIVAVLAAIVIPRITYIAKVARERTCFSNVKGINSQVELYHTLEGSWPASDLTDIGGNPDYFPQGIPPCPVSGKTYFLGDNYRIVGHLDGNHDPSGGPSFPQPPEGFEEGQVGYAKTFDGVNDYVEVSNEANFDFERTQPFSIEFWFKTTVATGAIVAKFADATEDYRGYDILMSEGQIHFQIVSNWYNNDAIARYTSSTFNDGDWHHFTGMYNGSGTVDGISIYVDGVNQSTGIHQPGPLTESGTILNDYPITIGSRHGTTYFDGTIDEVKIYSRTLTETEISQTYSNESQGQPSGIIDGLVGSWSLDGDYTDQSGIGNDGIFYE